MGIGFPLHINLDGNNCTVFGGGDHAARRVRELRLFGAKITVIAPTLCPVLQALSDSGEIRHIPRKYYRSDCTNAQLCVAATDDPNVNIAIATECKAKNIPVNVTDPEAYGNFGFPRVIVQDGVVVSVSGDAPTVKLQALRDRLQEVVAQTMNE